MYTNVSRSLQKNNLKYGVKIYIELSRSLRKNNS